MLAPLLEAVGGFVIRAIDRTGYLGVILLMGVESACIPLPSEVIMPFAGSLIPKGRFTLLGLGNAGALGCVLGSWIAYVAGSRLGRPAVERWGRWVLLQSHDLERADRWFRRWGGATVFWSRMVPVVRTFIAFPAGVARMPWRRFTLYTYAGSLPWCLGLAYAGSLLGARWPILKTYFHRFDLLLSGVALLLALAWLGRALRGRRSLRDLSGAGASRRRD